jgi:hypothetical protein
MSDCIIVTRHAATIDFVRASLPEFADAPVIDHVDDPSAIYRKHVAGVLPLTLAARCASVYVVEFPALARGSRDGRDMSAEEMRAAGARIVRYRVLDEARAEEVVARAEWGHFDVAAALDVKLPL